MQAPGVQKGGIAEKYALAAGGVRTGSCDMAGLKKRVTYAADAVLAQLAARILSV
jgi:hypothetical protein